MLYAVQIVSEYHRPVLGMPESRKSDGAVPSVWKPMKKEAEADLEELSLIIGDGHLGEPEVQRANCEGSRGRTSGSVKLRGTTKYGVGKLQVIGTTGRKMPLLRPSEREEKPTQYSHGTFQLDRALPQRRDSS